MAQFVALALLLIVSGAMFGLHAPGLVLAARIVLLFVTHFLLRKPHWMED
ncbi:hypothetical protein GCM10025762_50590 [Haloechinothrix salitolerans]